MSVKSKLREHILFSKKIRAGGACTKIFAAPYQTAVALIGLRYLGANNAMHRAMAFEFCYT